MTVEAQKYQLTEAQHQAIFERRIKPHLFAEAKAVERPVAVIFGGQPGAGKSASVDMALEELKGRGGAVQIIGDDLRGYHPRHDQLMKLDDKTAAFYTDKDSGRWVEKTIAEAKERRVNLVIEGTMRNGDVVASTMKSLREAGYEIDARALAVSHRLSEQGILQRYENQKLDRGTGRMTTAEAHRAGYDGMLATLERVEREKLADRVSLYRRGGEQIYFNELRNGQWTRPPAVCEALEAERSRPMTLEERSDYAQGYAKLAALVGRPERQARPDEIDHIEGLRHKARLELAAEVFRTAEPMSAVKQHPELAPAYGYLRSREARAEADGLNHQQRAAVMGVVRKHVADQIERGTVPEVQLREAREIRSELPREQERGRG